jgi:hypothetical protein
LHLLGLNLILTNCLPLTASVFTPLVLKEAVPTGSCLYL